MSGFRGKPSSGEVALISLPAFISAATIFFFFAEAKKKKGSCSRSLLFRVHHGLTPNSSPRRRIARVHGRRTRPVAANAIHAYLKYKPTTRHSFAESIFVKPLCGPAALTRRHSLGIQCDHDGLLATRQPGVDDLDERKDRRLNCLIHDGRITHARPNVTPLALLCVLAS